MHHYEFAFCKNKTPIHLCDWAMFAAKAVCAGTCSSLYVKVTHIGLNESGCFWRMNHHQEINDLERESLVIFKKINFKQLELLRMILTG